MKWRRFGGLLSTDFSVQTGRYRSSSLFRFSTRSAKSLTASHDKTARVWETASGKFLASLQEHKDAVAAASYNADGRLILTASADQSAKLWNMQLETRSPEEIAEVVRQKVPLRLEQGRLVPTNQAAVFENPAVAKRPTAIAKPYEDVSPVLGSFEFVTVTVDRNGNVKERHKATAGYFAEDLNNGVLLEMVRIPEGTFIMGTPEKEEARNLDERPEHRVSILSFFISKFEVTRGQWRAVASLPKVNRYLDADPSLFKSGDELPVERVSWEEAVEFCARLSKATGRNYRLPTEAEWEYAGRGGAKTVYSFGETLTPELANYDSQYPYKEGLKGNFRDKTRFSCRNPVEQKLKPQRHKDHKEYF